MTQTRAQIKPI